MSDKNSGKLSLAARVRKLFKKNLTEEEMDRLRCLNDGDRTPPDPDNALTEELRRAMDESNKIRHQLW